ncbi:MAG: hypothetical protein AAGD14_11665 [Planctomycetota bacterium]
MGMPAAVASAMFEGDLASGMRLDQVRIVTGFEPRFLDGDERQGTAVVPASHLLIKGTRSAKSYVRDGAYSQKLWRIRVEDRVVKTCDRIEAATLGLDWEDFTKWIPPEAGG